MEAFPYLEHIVAPPIKPRRPSHGWNLRPPHGHCEPGPGVGVIRASSMVPARLVVPLVDRGSGAPMRDEAPASDQIAIEIRRNMCRLVENSFV